jgi:hypothetical protein
MDSILIMDILLVFVVVILDIEVWHTLKKPGKARKRG